MTEAPAATMTSKERITVAMRGGKPDRVPVTLGLSEAVPVRFAAGDFIEFFWKGDTPLWRVRVETEVGRFGADGFLHLGEGPSPDDPPQERREVKETRDKVTWTQVIRTAKGELSAQMEVSRRSTISSRTHFVKHPEADAAKVLQLLQNPDTKDLSEILRAYDEIGGCAHVGYWINTPVEWWDKLRGTQDMIMDLCDHPALMQKLFDAYTDYACALTEHVLKNSPLDSVGLGGSSTSMSVINPDLHRRYSLPFGRRMCEVSHRYGRPVQYHMCGRSRAALPITVEMGVDGLDALECPPTGDVDLGEVKAVFGGRVSLRGNVNSITVMKEGAPADVERAVARCMDQAKAGGGYILGVGDQTPYETPEENMHAFVEAGRRLGRYA